MKIRVTKAFSDMYTHQMVAVGSIIEVDDKRGADIVGRGYGETIDEVRSQPDAPDIPEPAPADIEEKPKKRNSRKKKE